MTSGEADGAASSRKAAALGSAAAAATTAGPGTLLDQQTPTPASTASTESAPDAGLSSSARPSFSPALLRRLAAANIPLDVAEALSEEGLSSLQEDEGRALLAFCLQRGKVALALGVYREMTLARRGGGRMAGGPATRSLDVAFAWPAASLATTTDLVMGLCQQLCIVEALQVLADIKVAGMPRGSEEVGFGKVITSPLAPNRPLTVVQPQEGAKTVADGYSRYEYDVFSGTAVSCSSTALVPSGNLLLGLGRVLGLLKKPPVAAIHEFVLQAPDSTSRTFRVGTETAAVPAQVGERVTVVSAPTRNIRKGGLFNASPPGTKPGEALTATNHKTGAVLPLLRPPVSAEQAGVPGWVLPLAVALAGGDAASSLLDPALPLLLAAGAASLAGGTLVSSNVLVPRLKQLPDGKVRVEYVRQQLLGQYNALTAKASAALTESAEDVRFLARLWQLQNKMEAVSAAPLTAAATAGTAPGVSSAGGSVAAGGSGGAAAAYEARIGRVSRARANIEERLARRIELLDGYSRVMNMIEIEVEMDIEVPAAEVAGIQEQMARLVELESLQEDWRAQAEARDEVGGPGRGGVGWWKGGGVH
ncbi:hypothetical protein GPECTOR_11g314 [Gonium pectorale]|uniref:Uncharacterized protein n=1 Tax=Gonium pectorale TaxID=33097 RepID=A0A150GPX0_GONPE|nr:hypothetical protein GPECTOR_11g314 [Gonium pectorale]|eukprot:KXZ51879.1 hypothetical protein GPECTOR_11g314 [Gonium pectorale]